jgi:hypothetical protein
VQLQSFVRNSNLVGGRSAIREETPVDCFICTEINTDIQINIKKTGDFSLACIFKGPFFPMSPHSPGPFEPARNVCTQVNSVLSKIKDQSAMKDRGAEGFTQAPVAPVDGLGHWGSQPQSQAVRWYQLGDTRFMSMDKSTISVCPLFSFWAVFSTF